MKTMDNAKAMKAMEKQSLQRYLEKLADAQMHRITLFNVFPQTGTANLSDPAYIVLIDNTAKLIELNSGRFLN
ncbi:hypothetical protein ACFL37_00445 [Candidatus Margulisiibacteriota bacterium]